MGVRSKQHPRFLLTIPWEEWEGRGEPNNMHKAGGCLEVWEVWRVWNLVRSLHMPRGQRHRRILTTSPLTYKLYRMVAPPPQESIRRTSNPRPTCRFAILAEARKQTKNSHFYLKGCTKQNRFAIPAEASRSRGRVQGEGKPSPLRRKKETLKAVIIYCMLI